MKKEQIAEKRNQIQKYKNDAESKIKKVENLFKSVHIDNFIITGSQALIIQGFMNHRIGNDVDVRLDTPFEESERQRVFGVLEAWAKLYNRENMEDKYKENTCSRLFTFRIDGLKVNVFVMKNDEFSIIPCNSVNGHIVEVVSSVMIDKMRLTRSKDYEDLFKIFRSLSED